MPRKITAYACDYKCGRKVCMSKKSMIEHEKICFCNPIRKACQTCKFFKKESETIYNPYHGGNPGSTDYESYFNYCDADEDIDLEKGLRFNCSKWEGK